MFKKLQNHIQLSNEFLNDFSINDIDKPLEIYGMIYKYDINLNTFQNSNNINRRKIISICFSSFLALSSLRYFVYILIADKQGVPDYCFDFIQEMGGLVIYYYFAAFETSLCLFGIHYHFNTANESQMKWIQILKVLKGISPLSELKILDNNSLNTFIFNIRKYHKLLKLMPITMRLSFLLMIILIIIFVYEFEYFIK